MRKLPDLYPLGKPTENIVTVWLQADQVQVLREAAQERLQVRQCHQDAMLPLDRRIAAAPDEMLLVIDGIKGLHLIQELVEHYEQMTPEVFDSFNNSGQYDNAELRIGARDLAQQVRADVEMSVEFELYLKR